LNKFIIIGLKIDTADLLLPEKVLLFAFFSLISIKHNIAAAVIELSNIFNRNFFLHTTSHLPHLTKRKPFKCKQPE
jgi:hypothetical protein